MRSFVDSNLWIAASIRDGFARRVLREAMRQGRLVTTPELVAEVKEKLHRPTIPSFVAEAVERTMTILCEFREVSAPKPGICRDPDDDLWLGQAAQRGCHLLVSNDADLQVIGTFENVRIVSLQQFAAILALH